MLSSNYATFEIFHLFNKKSHPPSRALVIHANQTTLPCHEEEYSLLDTNSVERPKIEKKHFYFLNWLAQPRGLIWSSLFEGPFVSKHAFLFLFLLWPQKIRIRNWKNVSHLDIPIPIIKKQGRTKTEKPVVI